MKSDLIDRRINDLEHELAKLRQRKVALLRDELIQLESELSGSRPSRASRGWAVDLAPGGVPASPDAAGATPAAPLLMRRRSGGRGKRMTDEDVVERLRKVVAEAGSEGISARAAANEAGVLYLRANKLMADNFNKEGSGKWTRYTSK